uniref:Uncharacterized protein n=1 Tax=Parascaris univalens TaxID=6257 RepID=A0A915BR23_PARUN
EKNTRTTSENNHVQSGGGKISKIRWLNPESRQKVFVSGTYEHAQNKISLWSVRAAPLGGEPFRLDCQLEVADDVNDMKSCGGNCFAVALNNGDLLVVDGDDGKLLTRHIFCNVHQRCAAHAISSFDNLIVSGGSDGSIVIQDLNSNSQPFLVTSQMSSVRSLSMLTQNVLVSAHLCGRIYMWDTREKFSNWPWLKPVLVYCPTNTTTAVMTVAAHPADYHLISFGTEDGVIGFLDARVSAECASPTVIPFSVGCINEVTFHPTYPENVYCVSSEGTLLHLDATRQNLMQRFTEREAIRSNLSLRGGPSSFGSAKVTVLMEAALSTNSVDVCADGVILGDDSHMITFIEKGFFV